MKQKLIELSEEDFDKMDKIHESTGINHMGQIRTGLQLWFDFYLKSKEKWDKEEGTKNE